jgi:hypothetical protein
MKMAANKTASVLTFVRTAYLKWLNKEAVMIRIKMMANLKTLTSSTPVTSAYPNPTEVTASND